MLKDGKKLPAGEIAEQFDMTHATISYHLSQLKKAGLVTEINQFFEHIMVTVFFGSSMKLKLIRIPEIFQLIHIFSTKDFEMCIRERYKTAPSEEEQEKARQEYLDKRGVTASYRW